MKLMTPKERENLLQPLKRRFEKHMQRHPGMAWGAVEARLSKSRDALTSLHRMEQTGGDPSLHVHTMYRDPTNEYGRKLSNP